MIRKILVLLIIAVVNVQCSSSEEAQNLDINVTGKVTNQLNVGVADVS